MLFLKFFLRDFKSDRTFNWFYILCAALGIMGLLLVESFKIGIENKISRNAKSFIASDLAITSRRTLEAKEIQSIENYLVQHKFHFAKWIETYSLVSNVIAKKNSGLPLARLADLNFVSEEFPYYGGVVLEDMGALGNGQWGRLHSSTAPAWISRDLSWELGVKKGDQIKIGEVNFLIDGIIAEDNFSSFRGFSLAPKIFISYNYLKKTELIKFGSTATYAYAIQFLPNSNLKQIKSDLRKIVPDKTVKIMSAEESGEQIARALNILSDYLSLITLMTYLLSLVGLYYFTQHFLAKNIKTFSIYKTMGVKTSFLFRVNFLHLIILTMTAVVFSTAIILVARAQLEAVVFKITGESFLFDLDTFSILRIFFISLGGSTMALGPLLWGAFQIPVATIFQDLPCELKRVKWPYFVPLMLYISGLTLFLANSFKVGFTFLGSLLVVVIVGAICFKIFTVFLEKISPYLGLINRQAFLMMGRYFASSLTIFLCLLIGMSLIIFIFQLETSLRRELTQSYGDRRPDLFMFDLQDYQMQKFSQMVTANKWHQSFFAPMIRGRLLKMNDVPTQKSVDPKESSGAFTSREDQASAQMINRGVNLSYRSQLSWSEKIVAGVFPTHKCDGIKFPCELSLEQNYAKRLGVKLGDKLSFDISGVEISGIVTSIRTVKWLSFEPNFFILFQSGVLEEAPKTFLSSFKIKSANEKRDLFVKIAKKFPNVSLLDVSEIVKKITIIFDLMALSIKFISLLSLFVALVVLVAVSFNHLDLRKNEMRLYHLLGLQLRLIQKIYIREFVYLILLCSILSLLCGSILTMVLMRVVFDAESIFRFPLVMSILGLVGILLYVIVSVRVFYLVKK